MEICAQKCDLDLWDAGSQGRFVRVVRYHWAQDVDTGRLGKAGVPRLGLKCSSCLCRLHYPANTWGLRGGGRLSLSALLASMAETGHDMTSSGYFSRILCTSLCTLSDQDWRSACRLRAASISDSCRPLRPDSSSRLWLSWVSTGLAAAVAPGVEPAWGQSPSELLNRGEAWPDM